MQKHKKSQKQMRVRYHIGTAKKKSTHTHQKSIICGVIFMCFLVFEKRENANQKPDYMICAKHSEHKHKTEHTNTSIDKWWIFFSPQNEWDFVDSIKFRNT